MDPLSDIIRLLRPHAGFSKPISGRGRWGVRYEPYEWPSFCIVLTGQCWLTMKGDKPRRLARGDFLLLFATPAFELVSEPGVKCLPGFPSETGVRHGARDGAPDFEMLGGTFKIEQVNAAVLGLLEERIHIRAAENDTSRLAQIITLIMEEHAADRPGRDMILERFLEVLLVEALRWRGGEDNAPEEPAPGLLSGMRDDAIAQALRAMHSDVRQGWTVANLANHVGMSRSAFAARFAATVGCAPMEYLSRWRMSLAQDALSRGKIPLDRVAANIGYESASAFSTAFRKRIGCAPGAFARAQRATP
ncbi:MAG: AraC family transcriptional regulator [Rhodospirillaceae bacterium]|nr:AraC family transcriptional regulator [Rhodospirillaceae bacterium]